MNDKPQHPIQHYVVPAQSRQKHCAGATCSKMVYWILTPKGARMPIDVQHCDQCYPPTPSKDGMGVSHYKTCPDANNFSGRNRKK